jgi:hypothetical protein
MSEMLSQNYINTYQSIDELKQALEQHDKSTLLDALAFVIDTYIIHNSSDNVAQPVVDERSSSIEAKYSNFCSLLVQLKKNYSFPELKNFSIENNKVFFNIENRMVELKPQVLIVPEKQNVDQQSPEKEINDETYKRFSNLEME